MLVELIINQGTVSQKLCKFKFYTAKIATHVEHIIEGSYVKHVFHTLNIRLNHMFQT